MSSLADLQAWAIFVHVAEAGSFAQAARQLRLAQGTVSKAIAKLEAHHATTLFARTARRAQLTASGELVFAHAKRMLAAASAIESELSEQATRLRGTVRIAAPMSFGLLHLAPTLPTVMRAHPELTIEIDFADAHVDLQTSGFDLALRIGNLHDSRLLRRRICSVRRLLVAAPSYLKTHGRPLHPRDLVAHNCFAYTQAPSPNWTFHHPRSGSHTQPVRGTLRVNNAESLLPPLRDGLGMALQPEFLVWQDVARGQLEEVLPTWRVESLALYLLSPPGRRPARVQAVSDALYHHLQAAPWAGPV